MHLAYVMTDERGATDRMLSALAEALRAKGIRTAGIVQSNTECHGTALCDMDVQVLPAGETIRISQSLGPESRGCRLDPESLERAVGLVTRSLQQDAPQVLLVNKFGKHEAAGRGLRPLIGDALAMGIPVVAGVNRLNLEAFQGFAGGLAQPGGTSVETLVEWVEAALAATAAGSA